MDPFEGEYPKKNLRKLQDKKQIIKLPSECSKKPWEYRKKFLYCKNRRQNFNRRRGTSRNRARTSRNSIRHYL